MKLKNCETNMLTYICKHIFENTRPIKIVSYTIEGDLCMLCGYGDHTNEDYNGVGLGHLIDRDNSLLDIPELENGQLAMRSDDQSVWEIEPIFKQ